MINEPIARRTVAPTENCAFKASTQTTAREVRDAGISTNTWNAPPSNTPTRAIVTITVNMSASPTDPHGSCEGPMLDSLADWRFEVNRSLDIEGRVHLYRT